MKRQAMEGGAIIGQGHYGCVFDPPLLCEDAIKLKKGRRVVGKLAEETDAKDELHAAKVLSAIPNSNEYFVLADTSTYCKNLVPLNEQPDKKGVKLCEPIKHYGSKDMVHYTMPFGGISIMKYVESRNKSFPIREIVSHLLEGAALMTLNNYVHYDIHLGNLLIEGSKARFIDFGFSFSASEITSETLDERWKVYDPARGHGEPPEVTIITGLRKWYSLEGTVKQVAKEKSALKNAEKMLGLSRFTQMSEFMKFWNTSVVCKKKDWLGFFKMYWPAFDAWGVGFVILYIYSNAIYIKNVSPDWPVLSTQLKDLLRGLLRMDPRRRLDCVEALNMFNPSSRVLSSPSGKAWLKQRLAVRELI